MKVYIFENNPHRQITGNESLIHTHMLKHKKLFSFILQDQSHYLKSSWISNELQPLLNSLRLSIEAAATARAANVDNIRAIGIGLGAVAVATALIVIGLIVCLRMGTATKNRMTNAIMALCTETNMRPNNSQPPFRI